MMATAIESEVLADYWRQCAEEARIVADRLTTPDARYEMQRIAIAYECLADHSKNMRLMLRRLQGASRHLE
jgi:hypothetical protein